MQPTCNATLGYEICEMKKGWQGKPGTERLAWAGKKIGKKRLAWAGKKIEKERLVKGGGVFLFNRSFRSFSI
jgi:hypothetical protein